MNTILIYTTVALQSCNTLIMIQIQYSANTHKEICAHTVHPQFEPQGLINFMAQNHPGSNREKVEIETITGGSNNLDG